MEVLGLIFSNIHHKEVFEATRDRTIASAPVGGRYRLIDFPLSNMVNAGIHHIGIVTKNNYQSLNKKNLVKNLPSFFIVLFN